MGALPVALLPLVLNAGPACSATLVAAAVDTVVVDTNPPSVDGGGDGGGAGGGDGDGDGDGWLVDVVWVAVGADTDAVHAGISDGVVEFNNGVPIVEIADVATVDCVVHGVR